MLVVDHAVQSLGVIQLVNTQCGILGFALQQTGNGIVTAVAGNGRHTASGLDGGGITGGTENFAGGHCLQHIGLVDEFQVGGIGDEITVLTAAVHTGQVLPEGFGAQAQIGCQVMCDLPQYGFFLRRIVDGVALFHLVFGDENGGIHTAEEGVTQGFVAACDDLQDQLRLVHNVSPFKGAYSCPYHILFWGQLSIGKDRVIMNISKILRGKNSLRREHEKECGGIHDGRKTLY